MTAQLLVFLILAAVTIAGALNVILRRHPIHSALSLIVVMVSLAGLYLLLDAEFVAAIQIIVYAGAIMVLFVFVIMLLNAGAEERSSLSRTARLAGVPLAVILLAVLAYRIATGARSMALQPTAEHAVRDLALLLFRKFLFPFELTSILILIAILGALVLAKGDS